jgi:transcriptional regulator with XRE-family HTH domain
VHDSALYQSACTCSRVWGARAIHSDTVALPFCNLRVRGPRPRVFPRGYPHEPRTVGERIRRRRLDRMLTQRTLAERLGCWPETVAAWERDESEPLARRWPVIEAVLGTGLVPERDGLPGRARAARLRLGLTQDRLAKLAGVDLRTVRNVERGVGVPRPRTLARIAGALEDGAGG